MYIYEHTQLNHTRLLTPSVVFPAILPPPPELYRSLKQKVEFEKA